MKKQLLVSLLVISSHANAQKFAEVWECQDMFGNWSNILVVASVSEGRESGKISVAGVNYDSTFQVKGFSRRWDFGLAKDETYNFAFLIEPNGKASYYDFTLGNQVAPSILMQCRQRENKSN